MKESEKKFVRNWVYFGILLIGVLAFWAADWWSWRLIITIPVGIVVYFSIAIPIGGTAMLMNKK